MIRHATKHCLYIWLLLFIFSACVKLDRPSVEKHFYDLEVVRPEKNPGRTLNAVIMVQRLSISPRFAGRELVYKPDPYSLESDFYNLFFIPPAEMLTQDLKAWLERSGIFSRVVGSSSLAPSDYILEGTVNALYGDYTQEQASAVVKMEFFLMDDTLPERHILFSKAYTRTIPIPSPSPKALIKGLSEAVGEGFAQLEKDLRGAAQREGNHTKTQSRR